MVHLQMNEYDVNKVNLKSLIVLLLLFYYFPWSLFFPFYLPLVTLVFVFSRVYIQSINFVYYFLFYFSLISFLIINNVLITKTKMNSFIIILERVMKSFKNENVF